MADNYSSSVRIGAFIHTEEIEAAAHDALAARIVVAPLVSRFDASNATSNTYQVPILPALTASTLTETVDMSTSAFAPAKPTIAAGEVGWMTFLTDNAQEVSILKNLAPQIGRAAGLSIARKVDTDLCALFSGTNGGATVGGGARGAGTLNVAYFLTALYNLELANVYTRKYGIFHPLQIKSLRTSANSQAGTPFSNVFPMGAVSENGLIGEYLGVTIYQTTLCPTGGGGTSTSRSGIIMGGVDESPFGLVTWRPIRVETQRFSTRRADAVVITSRYGTGEIRDAGGIPVLSR